MYKDLTLKIDELIEKYEESLISDTIAFISINSERSEPLPGAPFGKGAREILDTVMDMGTKAGFKAKDYGVGVISLSFDEKEPDLGIWLHGDVVSAGSGWSFPPYKATLYKDRIIGRGATDNKGQLAAVFNLFKIFRELGIKLKYSPALFVGSCEESGMLDMKGIPGNPDANGFINVCKAPRLNLVPDGSFPLGYGAKGLCGILLKSRKKLSFSLKAGEKANPGLATAVFDTTDFPDTLPDCEILKGEKTVITAFTPPRHSSHPDPSGNMITKITGALLGTEAVTDTDRRILKFFNDISLDIAGKIFSLDSPSELMTPTVTSAQAISEEDGCPVLNMRVRFPIELTFDEVYKRIKDVAEKFEFDVVPLPSHSPYINDKDSETAKALIEAANEITGGAKAPYVNGATYAHYLPNAYIYGMEGNLPPDDFEKGRGGAHGIDECVSIFRLKRAMRIYARALLKLNGIDW